MSLKNHSAKPDDFMNLEHIFSDFRKYFKLLIAVFILVFPLVFAATYFKTPQYTSSASVMITNSAKTEVPGQAQADDPIDAAQIDSEVELLKSNSVAERVAKELALDKDPEFAGTPKVGFGVHTVKGWFKGDSAKSTSGDNIAQSRQQVVTDGLLSRVSIERVTTTRLIKVSFTSASKEKAALIANTWIRSYLQAKIDNREALNQQTTGWLSERIETLRKQVEQADRAVQEYKIANNLLSATGSTLTEQEISDLKRQLAGVQVERAESAARLHTARSQLASGSNGDDVGESLNSTVVSSLRTQAAQISSRLAELRSRYGPNHPEIIKGTNQLADINAQIQAEIQRIMSNLEAEDRIQAQRAGSISGSVRRAQGQLVSNSKAMVKLNELELNSQSARQLYESYLDRLKQTATQSGIQTSNASIVSDAKIATRPSSPNLAVSLLMAFTAAAITSGSAVMLRRATDSGLVTSKDIESHLGIRHLASIASLQSTLLKNKEKKPVPHRYIMEKSLSVFAEGFRNLRAAMLYAPDNQPKVIALTSALPGEGKTTTSVCLSAAFAMAGDNVVLVDCDLRRSGLTAVFGKTYDKGLVEVLSGAATLEESLRKDEVTGVTYLPLSTNPVTTHDIFGSADFDKLLDQLRAKFDFVILDTAPVLPVADTRILARKADFLALLVRWRQTPTRAVQAAAEILEAADVKIAGAALVQVDVKEQGKYGYGDSGYYYKEYSKYYLDN